MYNRKVIIAGINVGVDQKTGDFSVVFWARNPFGNVNVTDRKFTQNDVARFYNESGDNDSGEWIHFGVIYDNNTDEIRCYINGKNDLMTESIFGYCQQALDIALEENRDYSQSIYYAKFVLNMKT